MNNSDTTILSDRGAAILNSLNRHYNKAFFDEVYLGIKLFTKKVKDVKEPQ